MRLVKKALSFVLLIIMLLALNGTKQTIISANTPEDELVAYINVSNGKINVKNIKNPNEQDPDFDNIIKIYDSQYCIEVEKAIVFDIDSQYAYQNHDGTTYTFDITYYDEGNGFLRLYYDCMDYGAGIQGQYRYANYVEDTIYLKNTKSWKTATIEVDNAYFGNRLWGKYDFGIWSADWVASGYKSMGIVPVKEIKITKHTAKKPIHILSETDVTGHVFDWYKNDKQILNTFTNQTSKNLDCTINYSVFSEDGKKCLFKTEQVNLNRYEKKSIPLNIGELDKCGIYNLDIEIICKEFTQERRTLNFSVIKSDPNGIADDFMYVCSHLENYNTDTPERDTPGVIDGICDLISRANFKGVRSEFASWGSYERQKGVFDSRKAGEEIKAAVNKYNLRFLQLLAFGNVLYMNEEDAQKGSNCIPLTTEEISGWKEYVKAFINETKEFTDIYEIWNEPRDPHFDWRTYNKPAAYVNLAQETQNAACDINEKCIFTGTAPATIWDPAINHYVHMMDVLQNGGANYLDALSVHTYDFKNRRPEETLKNGGIEALNALKEEYCKQTGKENVDVWITEGGASYLSENSYVKTSKDVGAYNIRFATLLRQANLTKNYCIYTMENTGSVLIGRENGFGMVRYPDWRFSYYGKPLTAMPQYIMMAAYNYIMAQTEPRGDVSPTSNINIQKFYSKKFNKNLVLLNSVVGKEKVLLNLDCNNIELYDEYGNVTHLKSEDGTFSFNLSEIPCYIMGDFSKMTAASDDTVKISGSLKEAGKQKEISFILTDADAEFNNVLEQSRLLYVNQLKTDEKGEFEIVLNEKEFPEKYKIFVNAKNMGTICINVSKKYKLQDVEIELYNGYDANDKVDTVEQYKLCNEVGLKISFDGTHTVYKLISAFYKDNKLVNVDINDGNSSNENYSEYYYQIKSKIDCDMIKIFVCNDLFDMKPLWQGKEMN